MKNLDTTQAVEKSFVEKRPKSFKQQVPLASSVYPSQQSFGSVSPRPKSRNNATINKRLSSPDRCYTSSMEFKNYSLWKDKMQRCQSIPLAPDRLYINTYLEDYDSKLLEPTVRQARTVTDQKTQTENKKSRSSERKLFQRIVEMDVKATRLSNSLISQNMKQKLSDGNGKKSHSYVAAKLSRRPLKFENASIYDKPYTARLKLNQNYSSKSSLDVNYVIQLDFDSETLSTLIQTHGKDKNTVDSYIKYVRSKTSQDNFKDD
jgi:hypothetical protein